MKKFIVFLLFVTLFVGCERIEGKYKEGTYFGYNTFESYGKEFVSTAVIYVDSSGSIKSVFIDSTYVQNDINTTKKVLGDDYGMKETSNNIGVISGGSEWYEQIEVLQSKIIENQGLDFLNYKDGEHDSISGVTIVIDSYYKAVNEAIKLAIE